MKKETYIDWLNNGQFHAKDHVWLAGVGNKAMESKHILGDFTPLTKCEGEYLWRLNYYYQFPQEMILVRYYKVPWGSYATLNFTLVPVEFENNPKDCPEDMKRYIAIDTRIVEEEDRDVNYVFGTFDDALDFVYHKNMDRYEKICNKDNEDMLQYCCEKYKKAIELLQRDLAFISSMDIEASQAKILLEKMMRTEYCSVFLRKDE